MDPKNDPNNQASNTDKLHDPERGATITDQQSNAAREDQGKDPLPPDASHGLTSEEAAQEQAPPEPVAETKPPTTSPASGQQTSANLVQSLAEVKIEDPGTDGKRVGTLTLHFVVQPNDPRSEQTIVHAVLQDEYAKINR